MASSARPERVYHQDYIARIRFSNTLPPPPNPPKLLDIPGTGLSGGQYTSAAFASRLAREQPLNIEADAELGMPIDLVGLPGVFDGDERAIMARDPPPTLHAHDRALLKPLASLGKPTSMTGGVSFLRRTEYISSNQGSQRFESSTSKDLLRVRNDAKKRRRPNVDKEHPLNILRHVLKGFDIAYPQDVYVGEESTENVRGADVTDAEKKAWANPRHPSNSNLRLLDSYPVLPDLDAVPGVDSFIVTKFSTNPLAKADPNDQRLDVAILRPQNAYEEKYEERLAAYDADLTLPKPTAEYDYEFYLANDASAVRGIKRKFDVNDADNDSPELYNHVDAEGNRAFLYNRIRAYETYQQAGDQDNSYGDTVAVALHDPDTGARAAPGALKRLKKGAYFYPVLQRTNLRPKRKAPNSQIVDQGQVIDALQVTVRDGDATEIARRLAARARLDTTMVLPDADAAGAELAAEV